MQKSEIAFLDKMRHIGNIVSAIIGIIFILGGVFLLAEFVVAFAKIFIGFILVMFGFAFLFGSSVRLWVRR